MSLRGNGKPLRRRVDVALEVRCLAMRGQCGIVVIDLVEPEAVRVVAILDDVELNTAGLVCRRVFGVVTRCSEELGDAFGFNVDRYMQNNHGVYLGVGPACRADVAGGPYTAIHNRYAMGPTNFCGVCEYQS